MSRTDWEKCDETIQADSIEAIVAAAITGKEANHIEIIPCDRQIIESLLPSISDTPIISKAITWLSRQICLICLDAESSASETVLNPDDSSHLGVSTDSLLNPRCMRTANWVDAQAKYKNISEII